MRSTYCARTMARPCIANAVRATTITSSAANADARSRSRGRPSSAGRHRRPPRTTSPTSRTPSRSSVRAVSAGRHPDVVTATVWSVDDWAPVAAEHRARVRTWTAPHLARRAAGQRHPVEDFLFEYYSYSPSKLERWHPGLGHVLTGAGIDEYAALADYRACDAGVTADPDRLARRRDGLSWTRDLLALTHGRDARTNCFGLHEWAMVYRTRPGEVRHEAYPLRLGHQGTDEVVEANRLRCTHFDAFRFFTDDARPRNTATLTRRDQQIGRAHV